MTPLRSIPLASTGLTAAPLALGTVKIGRNSAVKYPEPFDLPSDDRAADLLRVALSLNITILDTAPAYGVAQPRLGRLMSAHADLARDNFLICSKVGEHFDPETATSTFDFSLAALNRQLDRSLTDLRTDRVDILLIHSDGDDARILHETDALEALRLAQTTGKARVVGVSTKTPEGALGSIRLLSPAPTRPAALMCTLNTKHTHDLPAVRAAHDAGALTLIKKPLDSGHHADPAEAFGFIFAQAHPAIPVPVVGTINPEHLRANALAVAAAITQHRQS